MGPPCLSLDVIPDELGNDRTTYPLTLYGVAGTQTQKTTSNSIIVFKMHNLHETKRRSKKSEDSDGDDSEDEEDENTTDEEEIDTDDDVDGKIQPDFAPIDRKSS